MLADRERERPERATGGKGEAGPGSGAGRKPERRAASRGRAGDALARWQVERVCPWAECLCAPTRRGRRISVDPGWMRGQWLREVGMGAGLKRTGGLAG